MRRPDFVLRSFLLDLGGHLGSWRLSVALMVFGSLWYAFLAIWSRSSPGEVVEQIAGLLPFWLLYALLLVNTAACFWRRLPRLRRDMSAAPVLSQLGEPDWVRALPGSSADQARAALRRHGARTVVEHDGTLVGILRRHAALGSYLFHGAFFLLAVGFLLSLAGRQETRLWVAEGERYSSTPEQLLAQTPPRPLSLRTPTPLFTVARVTPRFHEDQLLFTELAAELEFLDGRRALTRINRPVWLGGFSLLRLSGFGYAPRWQLEDRHGHVLDSAFAKLNVFPPGQRDSFRLPGYPHLLWVEVLPDHAELDGEHLTRTLNLDNPAFLLRVFRNRLDLGGELLELGDSYEFEGLRLGFPEIRVWGEFRLVSDPGAPLVFLAFLLGLAGLAFKLRGGRAELRWSPGSDDTPARLEGWGLAPPAEPAP